MARSLKFRDFRTNVEVEAADEKQAKILEEGGYTRVTANTPALNKPAQEPSTVAEHVAAAQKAQKAEADKAEAQQAAPAEKAEKGK